MNIRYKASIIILGISIIGIVGCVETIQKEVNNDIMDAFILIDEGLTKSQNTFIKTNEEFHKKIQETSGDIIWKEKADKLRISADSLYNYIQKLRDTLLEKASEEESANNDKINNQIKLQNEVDFIWGYLKTEAVVLKNQIDVHRKYLLLEVNNEDTALVSNINSKLNTDDRFHGDDSVSWESMLFEHMPLMAVVTIMRKLQSDIRNTEKEVLNYYYNNLIEGREE